MSSCRTREPPVGGHQRDLELLGEGDVQTVVEADVVPEIPRAEAQMAMREPTVNQRFSREPRFGGRDSVEQAAKQQATDSLSDLSVDEVRRDDWSVVHDAGPGSRALGTSSLSLRE